MSALSASSAGVVSADAPAKVRPLLIYAAILLTSLLIFAIARSGYYTAASRLGYWLGVSGAVLMLVLMLYPLSKRAPLLQKLTAIRHWFSLHMLLGVLGPVLILLHCTLRIGSTNAAVAFWSMVIVASSGVFGRFLYGRLHAGLYGRQRTFNDVAATADHLLANVAHTLVAAPALLQEMQAFGAHAEAIGRAGWHRPIALFGLTITARRCATRCRQQLMSSANDERHRGHELPWELHATIPRYLAAARDAAQYHAFSRLFAMWHALHIPLVALLAVSAVVHVIAVHMY